MNGTPNWEGRRFGKVRKGLEAGLRCPGEDSTGKAREHITLDSGLAQCDCKYFCISSLWNRNEF